MFQESHGFIGPLATLFAGVPKRHVIDVGRLLGMLAYVVDARHRRIVRRNLQFIHPEWSEERVLKLSNRVFQNMGVTFLEICQMTHYSREDILRRVRIRGEENLLNATRHPNGVILISAHLGNWEMAPLFTSCYLQKPIVSVAKQLHPKTLDRWILGRRTRFGNMILDKKGALPGMARTLREGGALGILIDQETRRSEGAEVIFLDRTVIATPVAALLARRYDSPVLPAFCVRQTDSRLTLIVEPPLMLQKTHDPQADLQANTQIMTYAIEKAVREYPEQWLWFHKRWKRHYPYLYPEDLSRRKRRRERKRRGLGLSASP
ncbi:MAG: hypothetical protein SV775_07480 [Thermodesulfobacteriota bacterium]|nr:hypothetical protein [Thermodesulfobacteriota bacterium]